MPRGSTPKTPPRKPYLPRVSTSPTTSSKAGPKEDTKASTGAAARRWTNTEYLELFNYVAANTGSFEGAVAGRTRNQAYQAWRCTVLPFITNALMTKDGGSAAAVTTSKPRTKKPRREDIMVDADDENKPKIEVEDENGGEN